MSPMAPRRTINKFSGLRVAIGCANPRRLRPELIYAPSSREAFVEAAATRGHLLVHTLDNVNARVYSYTPEPNHGWSRRQLDLPNNVSASLVDSDLHSEQAFVQLTGFLTPSRLVLADLNSGTLSTVHANSAAQGILCFTTCVLHRAASKCHNGPSRRTSRTL